MIPQQRASATEYCNSIKHCVRDKLLMARSTLMQGIMMEDGESKTAEEKKVLSDRTVKFEQFTNCDGLA